MGEAEGRGRARRWAYPAALEKLLRGIIAAGHKEGLLRPPNGSPIAVQPGKVTLL